MNYAGFSASDMPTTITTSTPLVYQFSPPRCLKKIVYSFESDASDSTMSIAVLDTPDLNDGNNNCFIE